MKKTVALILAFILSLSSFTIFASAEDTSTKEVSITVNFNGTDIENTTLQTKDGAILVPVMWLRYFGSMKMADSGSYYKFYYADQEQSVTFAKRIYIAKDGTSFDVRYYEQEYTFLDELSIFNGWAKETVNAISSKDLSALKKAWGIMKKDLDTLKGEENNSFSILSGTFSDKEIYNDTLYLPIEEILPFMNAKTGFSEDGNVFIHPNPISISQVLSIAPIADLAFNATDDIRWSKALTATAYICDTFLNAFGRLDRIFNVKAADIKDYEKLFKTYLADNETYLSAFDSETSPEAEALNTYSKLFEFGETALKTIKPIYDFQKYIGVAEEKYTDDFYEIFYKDHEAFGTEIKGQDIVEGFVKFTDYAATYKNQVDDHRHMLSAVYNEYLPRKLMQDSSSKTTLAKCRKLLSKNNSDYIAAINTEKLYGDKFADKLITATCKGLHEILSEAAKDYIMTDSVKKTLFPFTATIAITKAILPNEYKTVSDTALIGHMNSAVSTAYDAYFFYKYGDDFTADTLNNLRLSAIMTLVASRNAYISLWDENYEKIEEIDSWLTKLYLAADGVECDSSDYYGKKKEELKKKLQLINVDTPTYISDYIGMNIDDIISIWGEDCVTVGTATDMSFHYDDFRLPFWGYYHVNNKILYSLEVHDPGYPDSDEYSIHLLENLTHRTNLNELKILYPEGDLTENSFSLTYTFKINNLIFEFIWYSNSVNNAEVYPADSICISLDEEVVNTQPTNDNQSNDSTSEIIYSQYEPENNFSFHDGIITEYTGTNTHVNIPPTINGQQVVSISGSQVEGYKGFSGNTAIESVIIPEGVMIIDNYAFENCSNLKKIVLPNTLVEIGGAAFRKCSGLEEIILPKSLTKINSLAFAGCSSLTSIKFPHGLEEINAMAFLSCSNLEMIFVPKSIKIVGLQAFDGCRKLTDVYFSGTIDEYNSSPLIKNYVIQSCEIHYNSNIE